MAKKRKNWNQAMEPESAEEQVSAPQVEFEAKIDFDGWWAMVAPKIPSQHYKEVIKADFRARGLCDTETQKEFDEALKKYGVRI